MKGKMTVYEMIQELAQYPADQLLEVNVYADGFGVEAEAQEEAEEGDYIDAKVCIDEDIQEMSVEEYKKDQRSESSQNQCGFGVVYVED